MLVIHANWTEGALWLWAESLERYQTLAGTEVGAAPGVALESEYEPAVDLDDAGGAAPQPAAVAVAEPEEDPDPSRRPGPAHDHPFALPAAELARTLAASGLVDGDHVASDGTMALRLPTVDDRPLPSDRMRGVVGADDNAGSPEITVFTVPRLRVRRAHALLALLRLEERGDAPPIEFGHSLRYWMMIARLVLEMLEDQRFIPTLVRTGGADLHARWQPWLHDDEAIARLGDLLEGMPPVVRAVVDAHDGQPWLILDEAMRVLTDATVRDALIADAFGEAIDGRDGAEDAHVAWLRGLLAAGDRVDASVEGATEMLRDVGGWIGELTDTGQDRPLRLCLRLSEPPPEALPEDLCPVGDDVRWCLSLHLMGPGRDPVVIDAEQVWRDPAAAQAAAGGTVRHPEELLLAELGRAARVYPAMEAALSEAAPTGIDLTTAEASAFLTEHKDLLEESGFAVVIPEWWGQSSARLGARLQIDAPALDLPPGGLGGAGGGTAAGQSLLGLSSLVRYRWQVAVGDQLLAREEFEQLTKQNATLVRLHGQWVELRPDEIAQAASFFDAEPSGELSLMEVIRLAHGSEARRLGLPVVGLDANGWVGDLLGASSGAGAMPVLGQPEGFIGTLRPYQEVGLSWLAFLDQFGLGACLADDMGLGKTIQLIALLLAEREQVGTRGTVGPTLLVVPTSVVGNWERELGRFAPTLRAHVHHGPDRPVGDRFVEAADRHDVVITTYTLVSRDRDVLERVQWHRVVLDEAQYIKNPPTKQTATIRSLRTTRRIALTGTPVENRLSELWSIIEFCNPGYLGPPGEFRRRFAVPIERHRDQERAEQLRRLVRPFVLRRLKTDPTVITDLPPCVVTKEYATLTAEQAALYERTVNSMLNQVSRAEGIQRRGLVLATLVKLKQICNHPVQVDKKGYAFESAARSREISGAERESLALLSRRSGKATRLMSMMEEVLAAGHCALLFTQFRRMGHLLAAMIRHDLDAEVQFLHGGTPPKKRQQMIDRFQDPDGGVPIFILSLKAGGIGVNLTAANHVFHYDRWWNPAVENQATDRAFRIGQTRTVHVHKFVCQGTLEERIDQMIEQKTELARNIIGAGEDWLADLTTGELRELLTLRHTAMEGEA
jgi:superfamily II DNA or RNA helicase